MACITVGTLVASFYERIKTLPENGFKGAGIRKIKNQYPAHIIFLPKPIQSR